MQASIHEKDYKRTVFKFYKKYVKVDYQRRFFDVTKISLQTNTFIKLKILTSHFNKFEFQDVKTINYLVKYKTKQIAWKNKILFGKNKIHCVNYQNKKKLVLSFLI